MSMEVAPGEVVDRLSILYLKSTRTDVNVEQELTEYRLSYKVLLAKVDDSTKLQSFYQDLVSTNGAIWDLESDIRKGREGELGLEEVGRRAIQIRNLNGKRVATKNKINEYVGKGYTEVKADHASDKEEEQPQQPLTILVIGESCADVTAVAEVKRLSPEGPVPVLSNVTTKGTTEGMAGNVMNNLTALWELPESNYDLVKFVCQPSPKITKIRYYDKAFGQLLFRMDTNDTAQRITFHDLEDIESMNVDVIVVSDYCKGFLEEEDIIALSKMCDTLVVDTKKEITPQLIEAVDILKINQAEYDANRDFLHARDDTFLKVIVTKGTHGAIFQGRTYKVPSVPIRDTAGAGDTFLAGLIHSWAVQGSFGKAIEFANKCATQVVQQKGVSVVDVTKLN